MNKKIIKIKKYLSKRSIKAKAGATLVELVAVVCILAITSTTCISGMFAMADVAKRGQDLSYCERTSDMFSKQISIYGNSASDVVAYGSKPELHSYPADANGFMDAEVTKDGIVDGVNVITYPFSEDMKNDYFLYADPNDNYKLILAKFSITPNSTDHAVVSKMELVPVLTIDNVKSITFDLKKLGIDDTKYVLQYTITTLGTTVWDKATDKRVEYTVSSGVVLNNTNSSYTLSSLSAATIETKSPSNPASQTYIRIRTTSRTGINIS